MSTDWRTEIYAVNLDFRRFTRGLKGNLTFEKLIDGAWQVAYEVSKGWCCDYVVNQASGTPEVQIEVTDQFNLANLFKENSIQSVLVEGVRYERRDQDLLVGVPRVWRLRCQPIGDDPAAQPAAQRARQQWRM